MSESEADTDDIQRRMRALEAEAAWLRARLAQAGIDATAEARDAGAAQERFSRMLAARTVVNAQLRAVNAGLIETAGFLSSVLASSNDCIQVLDLDGRMIFMSEGGLRVMELDDFEALRNSPWPDLWEEDDRLKALDAVATARAGDNAHFQGAAKVGRGALRYWDVQVTPIHDDDGSPKHILAIARDVTEQHRAAQNRALLSVELKHRIKNTMATVVAIANQTLKPPATFEEATRAFTARLTALGEAHDMLTRSNWEGAPLAAVIKRALAPHRTGQGRFQITGDDMQLTAKQALSLSLALHELATNAAKYGALSADAGHVEIAWEMARLAAGGEPTFTLTWREIGGPPVVPPKRRGFGSRLIQRTLASDWGGEVKIDYAPSGVVFTLTAPLKKDG